MALKTIDVKAEFAKNKDLREEDVEALRRWIDKQPHLPLVSDLHLILFLQSRYFNVEKAKSAIDYFYTVRTHCPEFFKNRDPNSVEAKEFMDVCAFVPLPKLTHQNYRVMYCGLMDPDSGKFVFSEQLKNFDMNMMLCLMQEGTAEGLIFLVNLQHMNLDHITKMGIMTMKKFLYYLQDALPVRVMGLHLINGVPVLDQLLALMKPFMKKELMDVFHVHTESIESLYKFVPKECLPKDIGGNAPSLQEMHKEMKANLKQNAEYFKAEEKMIVDESRRPGKPMTAGDIFGVEDTFKKLDID